MISSKANKSPEYNSKIQYYETSFDFAIKAEKKDKLKFCLIYENEMEYSLDYNFIEIQQKHQQFKTIYDFFKFLQDCQKDYNFFISELNREYCDLVLKFSSDILDPFSFQLINKDKNKYIGKIKENKLLKYSADNLIEMCNNQKNGSVILNDISFEERDNCYSFKLDNHSYIIFFSKIQVIINIEGENKEIKEEIRTNYDIYNIIKNNKIDEREVFLKEFQIEVVINAIDIYIKDGKLELRVIKKRIPEAKFGENTLSKNIDYKREEYSMYFTEYFENFSQENNKKIFKFTKNKLRSDVFKNISQLQYLNINKKYKITGPFSTGKSITLFMYSRLFKNVIYINLKVLKKNKKDYKKCLNIIFSECCRVQLNKNIFDEKINKLKIEKSPLNQLLYIIEAILDSSKENIILILDQYKLENFDYEQNFMSKIEEFLNRTNFRLILCSSINDQEIRNKVIQTWIKFNGNNPPELNSETQEYYFYYYKLYEHKNQKEYYTNYLKININI